MKVRALLVSCALAVAGLAGPGVALAGPAQAVSASSQVVHLTGPVAAKHHKKKHKKHACTRTSSGSCIRGGEFCPQSKYHHSGWDAKGRRYVCKGNHTHPHWEKP